MPNKLDALYTWYLTLSGNYYYHHFADEEIKAGKD